MKTKKRHFYIMQVMILFMSILILWCTFSVITNGFKLWDISNEIQYLEQNGHWTDEKHSAYNNLIRQRIEIRDSSWIGYILVNAGSKDYTSFIRDTFLFLGLIPLFTAQLLIFGSESFSGQSLDERIIIFIGKNPLTKFVRNFFILFGALPLAFLCIYLIYTIISTDIKHWFKRYMLKKPLRCQEHCHKCSNTNCPSRFNSSNNRTANSKVISMCDYRKSARQ